MVLGRVLDADSKEPLAFVNITLSDGHKGTTTNIDGNFILHIDNSDEENFLLFSYVGYEKKKLKIESKFMLIYLKKDLKELDELVFFAGENPAYRIIRETSKNRAINDPYKLASFKLKTYNKFYFAFVDKDSLSKLTEPLPSNEETNRKQKTSKEAGNIYLKASEDIDDQSNLPEEPRNQLYSKNIDGNGFDFSEINAQGNAPTEKKKPLSPKKQQKMLKRENQSRIMDSIMATQHIFMSETVTEKKFLYPNYFHETILGNKMSGIKNPMIFTLTDQFQPFAFYKDYITLLEKEHLNPVSKGSLKRYEFFIEDTTYYNQDTVFIISFEPRKNQKFDALKGLLYISTDNYAIKNVIAETVDPDAVYSFRIQQQYKKMDGVYFPVEFNTDLTYNKLNLTEGRKLMGIGRSYIKEIEINPPLLRSDFDEVELKISETSIEDAEQWLEKYRHRALDGKESHTYQVMDSIYENSSLKTVMKLVDYGILGAVPLGPIDLSLQNILLMNQYEGFRTKLGLRTNSKLSNRFNYEIYAAYGFKDEALKYGTALDLHLNKKKDFYFRFSLINDVTEVAQQDFLKKSQMMGSESIRNFFTYRYDSIREHKVSLNYRPFPYTVTQFVVNNTQYNPTYNYGFGYSGGDATLISQFNVTEFSFKVRYAKGETYYGFGDRKIFINHKLPLLNFGITRGVNNVLDGDFEYWKLDFRLIQKFDLKRLGASVVGLSAGYIHGSTPYSLLYNASGGLMEGNILYLENMFQTMGLYEFASDRFISVFHDHNFGNVLLRHKYSRPELVLVNNIGFGALNNRELHHGLDFRTLEQGYFESGLRLDNLLRINYADLAYINCGMGVFHRYGAYQHVTPIDNWAARMTLRFSF